MPIAQCLINYILCLTYLQLPCFPSHFKKFIDRFDETLIMVVTHSFDILVVQTNALLQLFHKWRMLFGIVNGSDGGYNTLQNEGRASKQIFCIIEAAFDRKCTHIHYNIPESWTKKAIT